MAFLGRKLNSLRKIINYDRLVRVRGGADVLMQGWHWRWPLCRSIIETQASCGSNTRSRYTASNWNSGADWFVVTSLSNELSGHRVSGNPLPWRQIRIHHVVAIFTINHCVIVVCHARDYILTIVCPSIRISAFRRSTL